MLQEREKMATMGWRYASSKYNNISWSGHALILSKRSSKALQSSVLFCLVRTESHCGVCCLCVWCGDEVLILTDARAAPQRARNKLNSAKSISHQNLFHISALDPLVVSGNSWRSRFTSVLTNTLHNFTQIQAQNTKR